MGATQSTANNQRINGTALILNHKSFVSRPDRNNPRIELHPSVREGTDKDVIKLNQVLTRYGFSLQVETDLTTDEVYSTINDLAKRDHVVKNECLVIFVLSHGDSEGIIYSKDSHYYTSNIWNPFKNSQAFKGKPKLIFFQACRGCTEEGTVNITSPEDNSNDNGPSYKLPRLPDIPDFFIAYSTVEHRTSKRHITEGSWYIGTIFDELNKLQISEDLLHFMTRVTESVVQKRHEENGQTPAFVSQLNRPCYLPATEITTSAQIINTGITNDNSNDVESEIVSDGTGRMPLVEVTLSPLTQYPMNKQHTAHTIIFYTGKGVHWKSAQEMGEYLKVGLHLNVKLVELSARGDNFLRHMEKAKNEHASELQNSNCLLIFVFANIEYIEHIKPLEECNINVGRASYPTSYAWCPFLTSKCQDLRNKPKLFFFIDTHEVEDDAIRISRPVPDCYRIPQDDVTEHSDFLFVIGYRRAFFDSFKKELRQCVDKKTEILTVITNAIKESLREEERTSDNSNANLRSSHLESTLKYKLIFVKKEHPKTITKVIQGDDTVELTEQEQKGIFRKFIYLVKNIYQKFTSITEKCDENNRAIKRQHDGGNEREGIEENKRIKEEAKKQTSELHQVKYENRKLKQKLKENKLLIENIPETPKENLYTIFDKLCKCIQIPINSNDIKKISRQKKENTSLQHPPKISVELNSSKLRNQIVNHCKKCKVTGNDIGINSSTRIYINPYLIKEIHELFQYARNRLKIQNGPNFSYVWYTVDGKVLARKGKNSAVINIKRKEMVDYFVQNPKAEVLESKEKS